jgi:hypothetical protein
MSHFRQIATAMHLDSSRDERLLIVHAGAGSHPHQLLLCAWLSRFWSCLNWSSQAARVPGLGSLG